MGRLDFTVFIFSIVLLSFFVFPLFYWGMSKASLYRLERRPLLLDWRFLLPCLIYTFVLGFRYDYAYDWMQYRYTFEYLQRGALYRESTEKGYLFINQILGWVGFDYYSIFILEGFIYVLSIGMLCKHDRKVLVFVLPIVYIVNRFNCLNISRQFFAMSVLMIAVSYLLEGKKMVYWILSLVSATIHASAIIYVLPFYFIPRLFLPKLKITLVVYFSTWAFSTFIFNKMLDLSVFVTGYIITNKDYSTDTLIAERFLREELTVWRVFVNMFRDMTYIFLFYYLNRIQIINKRYLILVLIGLCGILCRIFGGTNEITSRFMYYVTIFSDIGLGILFAYSISILRKLPVWLVFMALITFIQIIWSFWGTITLEVLVGGHYFRYL